MLRNRNLSLFVLAALTGTNYPTVTGDGRVIYTRWDYNDRGQLFPQGPVVMNADGTGLSNLYGNNSWFPTTIMHTRKILAVLSGHHTHQRGKLAIIDPAADTQEAAGVTMLPPHFAGSSRSELISMLKAGHQGVKLTRPELERISCWIDLLVPYCGDYTEAAAWTPAEKQKYAKYRAKRKRMEAEERANIEAKLGR